MDKISRRVTEIPIDDVDDLEEIGVEKEVPEEEQFPLLLKTIGNLETRMNDRFDGLESRIDDLESRVNDRFTGLETRVSRLETSVSRLFDSKFFTLS